MTPAELGALEPFFGAATLSKVRICVAERIEPPIVAGMGKRLGFGLRLDLSWVRGMAFDDAIVVAGSEPSHSLLFHELVHVVQYQLLGVRPFLRRYVADYFETGGDYLRITAEECAYALQERFDAAPRVPFSVVTEVERWFSRARASS